MRPPPARLALVVLASAAAGAWIGMEIRANRDGADHEVTRRFFGGADDSDQNEPDEVLPDDVLLTMVEGHMSAQFDYRLTVRRNGAVVLEPRYGAAVNLHLSAEQMHEVVKACLNGGLGSMQRTYNRPRATDGGHYALTLNAVSLKKSLSAVGSDADAGPALKLFEKLRALIGVDAHIGWNAGPLDPPDSRPADGK